MRRLSDILASGEGPKTWRESMRSPMEMVEPSEDEKRNGWTAETLTKYLQERRAENFTAVFEREPRKPKQAKGYRPLRWRG